MSDKQFMKDNQTERMDAMDPFFNHIRRKYHMKRYFFANEHIHGDVLDAGCGLGYGSTIVCTDGLYTGLDVSKEAIAYASKYYPNNYIVGSLDNPRVLGDRTYDSIICFEVLEHLDNPIVALQVFHKHLKDKGTLVLSIPNESTIGLHHKRIITLRELKDMVGSLFSSYQMYFANNSARLHSGIFKIEEYEWSNKPETFICVARKD